MRTETMFWENDFLALRVAYESLTSKNTRFDNEIYESELIQKRPFSNQSDVRSEFKNLTSGFAQSMRDTSLKEIEQPLLEEFLQRYFFYSLWRAQLDLDTGDVMRQHFVPNAYSKWFADVLNSKKPHRSRFSVFTIQGVYLRTNKQLAIVNESLLEPFYLQSIEKIMMKVENDYAQVIHHVLDTPSSNAPDSMIFSFNWEEAKLILNSVYSRIVISSFLALQYIRTPYRLDRVDFTRLKNDGFDPKNFVLDAFPKIALDIAKRNWKWFETKDPIFFSSDPIIVSSKKYEGKWLIPIGRNLLLEIQPVTKERKNIGGNFYKYASSTNEKNLFRQMYQDFISKETVLLFGSPLDAPFKNVLSNGIEYAGEENEINQPLYLKEDYPEIKNE